ncbi:chymotrypsinogen A [Patella vulgata]|uniref:chymotrypsinogen A n=1 Tax=Patella vulgata TaxID=6465 RepID=UPI0021803D08|nr:chymotrypsinogen A [Patella vulgata]
MNRLALAVCLMLYIGLSVALPCEVVTNGRGICFQYNCPSTHKPLPSGFTNPHICVNSNFYPSVCCEPDPAKVINNPYTPYYPYPSPSPSQPNVDGICGISKTQRILAGTRATQCAWPWQVSIRGNTQGTGYTTYENSLPLCAGVLIDKRWVLTSAYCPLLAGFGNGVTDVSKNLLVVVGENNIDKLETDPTTRQQQEQVLTVKKHFLHPLFKYSVPSGYPELLNLNGEEVAPFNVALLQLSQDVQITECRKPACLPAVNPTNPTYPTSPTYPTYPANTNLRSSGESCSRKDCYIAGWGLYDNTTYSSYLLQTQVNLFQTEVCDAIARATGKAKRPDGTLCGEPLSKGNVPCTGDNGGMLVCNDNGRWTLRGIISKSFVECSDKEPITVADVANSQIRTWIDYIKNSNRAY